MKKALYAIMAIALLASCAKEQVIETPETPVKSGQVKINFKIASPGGETKAVKQGWEMYDKISFWFNDMYENPSATNLVIRDHDLELTMYSTWEDSYQIGELADNLTTKGTLIQDYPAKYLGDSNGNGIMDADEFEYRDVYRGHVYALWVSGNNLLNANKGWTRYESHPVDGHNYLFPYPASFAKPENMSPMVLSAGFTSNSGYSGGGVDYIYDPVDNSLSLVSPTDVYQKISLTWKFYTNFQITITGLESGHVYGLKSPQFGSNFMYIIHPENERIQLTRMINAATEAAHFGLEERATADVYGEAVFFGQGISNTDPADFTFTLEDKNTGEKRTCTKTGKTITCSDTRLAAIKLKFADFKEPSDFVMFEDETFKAYCVANFDTDGDGEISIDEALAVTEIECINSSPTHQYQYEEVAGKRHDYMYASSLKGIEEFKNLQILNVSGSTSVQGPLASLDLRQNTALTLLVVNFNDIESLNIEGLNQLEGLECCYTKLSEIDAYGLSSLKDLNATNDPDLKKINISQCTSFTTLDIENTLKLEHFECASTKLTKLNLSYQPNLSYVNCSNCSELEELDLSESKVSNSITWANCPAIKKFLFGNTWLATWPAEDFAGFSYLEEVDLNGSNYAGTLDLSDKGHLKKLDAGNNQLLTGITVAERAPIEDFACANSGVTSLDIERLSLLNNFNCANCEDLESLTVKNCKISNSVAWTGCDELKTLNLYGTEIISWPAGDFNVFPALEDLNISYTNYVYALDMSCNGGLKSLECENAGISSINVSGLPELVFINCSKNSGLTALNLSGRNNLKALDCRECSISTLNLTGCTALKNLYCAQNNIETLNLQSCSSLQELDCSLNKIGTLDIHYCSLLNALKAWPQSEGYSLHLVVLSSAQSDKIDAGTLKLYDTDGVMTEAEMYERYHTLFDMHY